MLNALAEPTSQKAGADGGGGGGGGGQGAEGGKRQPTDVPFAST